MENRLRYRPEVDGLRSIAVMSVILWHAGMGVFAGGFLGVDIFFVISGYLITGIIVRDLAEGRFSLADFYERRIRRIIPALIVVMFIAAIAAYFLMLPDDLENFGQSLVATTFFANNILLLLTSGYFELETEFKPLLHTWSLAVEEQYYLTAPLLIWGAFQYGRRRGVLAIMVAISLASFVFSLWATTVFPEASFLLITSRAWELGVGAIAMLIEPRLRSWCHSTTSIGQGLSAVGLVMLCVPLVAFNSGTPPLLSSATVALGTCLFLIFAEGTLMGRVLAIRPFVAIGLISYSAYLYHQPVFAFTRITSLDEPTSALMLGLVPFILLLAFLSWGFIEQPFRDRSKMPFRAVGSILGSASVGILVVGLVMYGTSGFYRNWPEFAQQNPQFGARQDIAYNMRPFAYLNHRFDENSRKVKLLVLGNSFARDFINMAIDSGNSTDAEISYSEAPYCEFMFLADPLKTNISNADFIVLAPGVVDTTLSCVAPLLAPLKEMSAARLIVLGAKNFGWNNNAVMLLPARERYAYHAKPLQAVAAENARARTQIDPAIFVDILGMISDSMGRVPVFTPEHKFISQDRSHLTQAGAAYIGSIIFKHPALQAMTQAQAQGNLR